MSAALFAGKLMKLPDEEAPEWLQSKEGKTKVLLAGNLFGLILVAAMVYGIYHMTWWIPVICLFISFPAIHVIVMERLFNPFKGVFFSGFVALASTSLLWLYW